MMQAQDARTDVVAAYLSAFYSGDFESVKPLLADDFSFSGPFVSVTGRDAFLESAKGLKAVSRGHRLLKQWCDGEDVCSIYEVSLRGPAHSGTVVMAEWHTVANGTIDSARVLFDSAPFRAILAPQ